MKPLVLVLVFVFFVQGDDRYTTKYDNIDIDEILKSQRLLKNYVNCLMDRGGCTPEGKELKTVLPDALLTGCSKCSDAQVRGAKKVIRFLANNNEEWFLELIAKYDPDGVFKEKYEATWIREGEPLS